jgi:hypothetical protein
MVLYMALLTAFSFLYRRKKTKKKRERGSQGEGRREELSRIGGGRAGGVLAVFLAAAVVLMTWRDVFGAL